MHQCRFKLKGSMIGNVAIPNLCTILHHSLPQTAASNSKADCFSGSRNVKLSHNRETPGLPTKLQTSGIKGLHRLRRLWRIAKY